VILQQTMLPAEMALAESTVADDTLRRVPAVLERATLLYRHFGRCVVWAVWMVGGWMDGVGGGARPSVSSLSSLQRWLVAMLADEQATESAKVSGRGRKG
jgi:hypothetical protein